MIDAVTGTATTWTTRHVASAQTGGGGFAAALAAATGNGAATGAAPAPSAAGASSTVLNSSVSLFATPEEEQDFSAGLTSRLKAAGVDTSQPIDFVVQADGSVVAAAGTPGKAQIDAVFAKDPALANEYRKIANTEETSAIAKAEVNYMAQAKNTGSAEQATLWQQCSGLIDRIKAVGSTLTLDGGEMRSACSEMVAGLDLT